MPVARFAYSWASPNLHGEGVNIAARLETVCPPGAICVSRVVRDHVGNRLGLRFEQLGPLALKNIAEPVDAFVLRPDTGALTAPQSTGRGLRCIVLAAVVALLLAAGAGAAWWRYRDISGPVARTAPSASALASRDVTRAPRLSVVVLPFDNLDRTPEQNPLADGITEDLTTALAQKMDIVVTARNSAFAYKGKPIDIKRVGNELSVRYAVEGSVRKIGAAVRVNVQLVSTETGAHLWAYQVDADAATGGPSQDEFIWRISYQLYGQLIDVESARGARERPGNPDATDVLLQAVALANRPYNRQQTPALVALYERAVQLDPSSAEALAGLAFSLLNSITGDDDPTAPPTLDHAAGLVAKAESLQPGNFAVMLARAYLLLYEQRLPEAAVAGQDVIDSRPNNSVGYHVFSAILLNEGRAAESISTEQRSIRLDPHSPYIFARYRRIGQASLLLGQYDEAIAWEQRALAAIRDGSDMFRANRYMEIAAAQAFADRTAEARASAAEVSRLAPTLTVRSWWMNAADPALAVQVAYVRDGMRLAGVRDHAAEDADLGVVSDDALHTRDEAFTPTTAPGARTIRTADLVAFHNQQKPLVLDVNTWGKSIPGAIGLPGSGIGGTTSDSLQVRLGRKMQELTHGNRSTPVVTMAWNAYRFSGRNLALRLVALGYTDVIWYRGGREAWEVAGQPETEVTVQDW